MIACDVKIQPEKKDVCCEVFVNLQRSPWIKKLIIWICVKQANTVFFVKYKHCFNLGQI